MRPSDFSLEKKADDFRQYWGYGTDKPINLQSLLLELNVMAAFKVMDKVSGMAYKAQSGARFMLINSGQTLGRQNFTICHELYHLFVQKEFNHKICSLPAFSYDKKDPEEYSADVFAAFLLLPTKGIRDLIPENEFDKDCISLDTIIKIEQSFQCSRTALLHRLKKNMKCISDVKYDEFSRNIRYSAYQRGFPTNLYEPSKTEGVWGNYGELAFGLFESGKISEGDFSSLMLDIGVDIFQEPSSLYPDI